jgi:hypothetical protein
MFRFVAILLLLSLSVQCLVKLGIVAWYQVNKSYVSQTLCENRDKPQTKCKGKCYLKKKLAKAGDESDKSKHKTDRSNNVSIDFLVTTVIVCQLMQFGEQVAQNGFYCFNSSNDYSASIFHPPGLLI